jgi:purine-binding chemotaxis protein CheW
VGRTAPANLGEQEHNRLLVLRLAGREVALPLEVVSEMIRMVALTPLPDVPAWLCGVLNLRGVVVPVVDLRARLGLHTSPPHLNTPISIVHAGDRLVGLLADEAVEIVNPAPNELSPAAEIGGSDHPVVAIAELGGGLLPVVDVEKICTGTEDLVLPDADELLHAP